MPHTLQLCLAAAQLAVSPLPHRDFPSIWRGMSSGLSQNNPRGHTGYTTPKQLGRAHSLTQRVKSIAQSRLCW